MTKRNSFRAGTAALSLSAMSFSLPLLDLRRIILLTISDLDQQRWSR
jgi:hypothetical protein